MRLYSCTTFCTLFQFLLDISKGGKRLIIWIFFFCPPKLLRLEGWKLLSVKRKFTSERRTETRNEAAFASAVWWNIISCLRWVIQLIKDQWVWIWVVSYFQSTPLTPHCFSSCGCSIKRFKLAWHQACFKLESWLIRTKWLHWGFNRTCYQNQYFFHTCPPSL